MLELRIQRRLDSPNTWNGRHWRVKHRLSQEWELEIAIAVARLMNARTMTAVLACFGAFRSTDQVTTKRRVEVSRHVPSTRHFIRDDDNLRFCVKPLNDALKRLGYIRDDSRKWLEHPTPTQHVSSDGKDWTIITIRIVR